MTFHLATLAISALLSSSATLVAAASSGSGTTTRYWDCCKPSCAWDKGGMTSPVKTCDVNDKPLPNSVNEQSGCNGGGAYMCSDQTPWAINDHLAYGFTAVSGGNPACCSCYALTFTSGPVKGKKMIVQATNTGGDVGATQFDLAMPGGGFGIFDGCSTEWKATTEIWGAQYGGPSTNTCSSFPKTLQSGCGFRWDWMQGADNPTVDFQQVTCPAELVAKSGCSVKGYSAPAGGSPPSSPPATGYGISPPPESKPPVKPAPSLSAGTPVHPHFNPAPAHPAPSTEPAAHVYGGGSESQTSPEEEDGGDECEL